MNLLGSIFTLNLQRFSNSIVHGGWLAKPHSVHWRLSLRLGSLKESRGAAQGWMEPGQYQPARWPVRCAGIAPLPVMPVYQGGFFGRGVGQICLAGMGLLWKKKKKAVFSKKKKPPVP
jgi:hypothetical protein